MTEFIYNTNNFDSKSGTSHAVEERNGDRVITDCGLELVVLHDSFDTENGDRPSNRCRNCDWGDQS